MRCKYCPIPKYYDYGENVELCSLFGYIEDEHFKEYADEEKDSWKNRIM